MLCKIVLLALLGFAAAKTVDRASFGVLNLCQQYGWPTGTYPHPYDCRKFLQCNGGVTAELDCPAGQAFNPNTKICDAYANVPICHYSAVNNPIYVNNLCSQYGWGNGVYYHPYDCAQYINCNYGVTTLNQCPYPSVWDPSKRQCMSVNGPVSGGLPPYCSQYVFNPPTYVQPAAGLNNYCKANNLQNGIHPSPFSCFHYIECTFGVTNHMQCPAGLSFDNNLLVCDDQRYNNCGGNLLIGK